MVTHPHPPVETQLDQAAALCEARGGRLTLLRRQVLELVLSADRPIGAYDLLDRLKTARRGAAPPTVYRALDFLIEHGLIHRIERLSAFVGCPLHDHAHAAQFLICKTCGAVQELEDAPLQAALHAAAQARGFAVHKATIEAEGHCAACAPPA